MPSATSSSISVNSVSTSSTTPFPIAHRTPGVKNPARNLVQHERLVADVHRVAGVRATLIANDPVRALGEHVDELSFAFVAPLGADDDDGACFRIEHRS